MAKLLIFNTENARLKVEILLIKNEMNTRATREM